MIKRCPSSKIPSLEWFEVDNIAKIPSLEWFGVDNFAKIPSLEGFGVGFLK